MVLSPRFSEALVFATQLHRHQTRKGPKGIPYVAHLLTVTGIVLEHGGTEDDAIAALLHDAVEDQGGATTRATIHRLFGEAVASTVDACTDTDQFPKPPWRQRKQQYIEHLRHATGSARLVSAADKLANARSILADFREVGDELWLRFNCSREDVFWYFRTVLEVLRDTVPEGLEMELERAVEEMESLDTAQVAG